MLGLPAPYRTPWQYSSHLITAIVTALSATPAAVVAAIVTAVIYPSYRSYCRSLPQLP